MKKLLLIICIIFLFTCDTAVYANESLVDYSVDNVERIFTTEIEFSSIQNIENMNCIKNDLEQIVLCSKKGGEILTVGILKHVDDVLDYDYAEYVLQNELCFLGVDDFYSTEDFYVDYYEINKESECMDSLSCIKQNDQRIIPVDSVCNTNILPELLLYDNSIPIDSSYYFFNILNQKFWHNAKTNEDEQVISTPTSPFMGDGNNRYALGYQWFPGEVNASFMQPNMQGPRTFVNLYFTFSNSELSCLNVDSNEALEMEIVFYNYTNPVDPDDTGYSFVPVDGNPSTGTSGYDYTEPFTWSANFDNAYLDTTFFDSTNEISSCVGIYDTSELVANKEYYWRLHYLGHATAQGYPNDGRYRVVAQRSYRILPESLIGGNDEFLVFSEEKEGIIKYGLSENQNWVDSSLSAFVPGGGTRYWSFDISTDPVKHDD